MNLDFESSMLANSNDGEEAKAAGSEGNNTSLLNIDDLLRNISNDVSNVDAGNANPVTGETKESLDDIPIPKWDEPVAESIKGSERDAEQNALRNSRPSDLSMEGPQPVSDVGSDFKAPPLVPASILGLGNLGDVNVLAGLIPEYRKGRVMSEPQMLKRFKATKVKKKEIKMLHYIVKDWESAAYQVDSEFEKKAKRACQRCERLGKRCRVRKYGSFPCRECIIHNIANPGSCCAMPVQRIKVKCTPVSGPARAKVKTCFVDVIPTIEGIDTDSLRCPKLLGNVEYKCEIVERKERKLHHLQGRRTFPLTKCSQYYPADKCNEQVDNGCVWSSGWCRLQGGPLKNLPSRPSRVRRRPSEAPDAKVPALSTSESAVNPDSVQGPRVEPVQEASQPAQKRARVDDSESDNAMAMNFLRSHGFDVSMFEGPQIIASPPPAAPVQQRSEGVIEGFPVDRLPEDKNVIPFDEFDGPRESLLNISGDENSGMGDMLIEGLTSGGQRPDAADQKVGQAEEGKFVNLADPNAALPEWFGDLSNLDLSKE